MFWKVPRHPALPFRQGKRWIRMNIRVIQCFILDHLWLPVERSKKREPESFRTEIEHWIPFKPSDFLLNSWTTPFFTGKSSINGPWLPKPIHWMIEGYTTWFWWFIHNHTLSITTICVFQFYTSCFMWAIKHIPHANYTSCSIGFNVSS